MGGKIWKQKMIAGLAVIAFLGVLALPASAGTTIPMQAVLVTNCPSPIEGGTGCATWPWGGFSPAGFWLQPGTYSLLHGATNGGITATDDGTYIPSLTVQSEILTHNTVYTLDTMNTLGADGKVNGSTITVKLLFYTTASNVTPPCWSDPSRTDLNTGNDASHQTQAVNWSILSQNSTALTEMVADGKTVYPGFARLDFNVRNGVCENNIFRFYLKWPLSTGGIGIKRLNAGQWEVTTDPYGTASLYGQGGRKGQTQYYGDYRLPFRIILMKP